MPNLRFIVFSDGFVRDNQSPPWIFNPFMTLRLPSLPWSHTFTMVFGIDEIDANKNHNLKVVVRDPKDNKIFDQTLDFPRAFPAPMNIKPVARPDGKIDLIGSMDIRNMNFAETEGSYTFTLEFDGTRFPSAELFVMKQRGEVKKNGGENFDDAK